MPRKNIWKLTLGVGAFGLLALVLTGCGDRFPTTGWPIEPTDSEHEIGNSAGEFQQYGGNPYFHGGIDILDDPAPNGPWVRVVREGNPVLLEPGAGSTQNGLIMTHTDGDVYLYWHLDHIYIQQAVRDAQVNGTTVAVNTPVSRLMTWPDCNFHHLHYVISDAAGTYNPIFTLNPRNDTTSPVILDVFFTQNATNTQFPTGAQGTPILSGNADVIVDAYDTQFGTARTGVWELSYRVTDTGGTEVKAPTTIRFTNIPANANASIIYRNSAPFDSNSNYCGTEEYYYVLTNVDANGNIISDANGFWDTTTLADGVYQVHVRVRDPSRNDATMMKQVNIDN